MADKTKKIPERMCLGCRCMKPKRELLRIVRSPEGAVSFDETQKASGRGAYVCKSSECFKRVIKTKALSRTLNAAIPEDVTESLKNTFDILSAADTIAMNKQK